MVGTVQWPLLKLMAPACTARQPGTDTYHLSTVPWWNLHTIYEVHQGLS